LPNLSLLRHAHAAARTGVHAVVQLAPTLSQPAECHGHARHGHRCSRAEPLAPPPPPLQTDRTGAARNGVCHRPSRVRRPRAPPRRALAAARQGLPARQPRGRRRRASPVTLARGPSLPLQMTRRRHGQRAWVLRPPARSGFCLRGLPLASPPRQWWSLRRRLHAEGSMCCSAHSASP
jgi:hypothetical protein